MELKLLKFFFIFIVGVAAQPLKDIDEEYEDVVDEELHKIVYDAPFLAFIRGNDSSFSFQTWAIILTDTWLLSSFNYSQWTNYNLSVQLYSDLRNVNSTEHEIELIIEYNESDPIHYPPFELIKLKKPISVGDLQKPIPLAGLNYLLLERTIATAYHLTSIIPHSSKTLDYFHKSSVEILDDDNIYKSELSSCLKSHEASQISPLYCDPTILDDVLVGFSLRINCKKPIFLKINFIYDWISQHVPGLKVIEIKPIAKYTTEEKLELQALVLKKLFGASSHLRIADQVHFNNVTININHICKT